MNPSPPRETGNEQKKYSPSEVSKCMTDRQIQIGLLGKNNIGRANISLRAPLIYLRFWSTNAEDPSYVPITSTSIY